MSLDIGDRTQLPRLLENIGASLLVKGQPERAVLLWGASQAFRERTSTYRPRTRVPSMSGTWNAHAVI